MLIYVSGKITGLPIEVARANFANASNRLRSLGFKVINPMELPHEDLDNYAACMALDLLELNKCAGIYLLGNYQDSKGALIEYETARLKKMVIINEADNLENYYRA